MLATCADRTVMTGTGPATEWSGVLRWVLELTPTSDTLVTTRWSSIRALLWYVSDTS